MGKTFQSLRGQLLLDGGKLFGSFFHRTVVLICQHDSEGAFGLVVNRPADSKVSDALVAHLPDSLQEQSLYLGGPVQPTALSFLYTDSYIPDASVIPNLELGHSLDALVELGESMSSTQQIRVFAGYAGWSAGQLDDEMKRGAWLTHPASIDLVFYTPPIDLWKSILRTKGWQYRLLAESPQDLSWN